MQIQEIVRSLMELWSTTSELAATLPGELHHGTRAPRGILRPFGLLTAELSDLELHTSGVSLVTYLVTLQITADQQVGRVGEILTIFHRYWDRIARLPALDPDLAEFIRILPEPGSDIGETDQEELGRDTIVGTTAWTILVSETQPALGV